MNHGRETPPQKANIFELTGTAGAVRPVQPAKAAGSVYALVHFVVGSLAIGDYGADNKIIFSH
jgi:hypothetical protein